MTAKNLIDIKVPFPEARSPELHLELSSCLLNLRPSESDSWVAGTYDDLNGSLPLRIQEDGASLRIVQNETLEEKLRLQPRLPPLDLALGKGRAFGLSLVSGLVEGRADLSGLSLTRLEIRHGKGDQEIVFAAPNPQSMESIRISAGAARLAVRGLGNANFSRLKVDGGLADYLLDFSGTLRRPAQGEITIPNGSVEIQIPETTAARISVKAITGSVDAGEGFTRKSGAYWNKAAVKGQAPLLVLKVTVIVGKVLLRIS
jgi:hypothetical protein